jgi:hypothetical protein
MFWNRNKKNKNTDNSAEEQRPRVAQTTTISMGNAPGVWVKTTGNTDVNPVVLVATSERVALVESADTFMYDLKNSENDSEIVSALAWSPRPISLIAAGADGTMRVVHTENVEPGTVHNYAVTTGAGGNVSVTLTVIDLTATFPTEERPEHVTETSWLNMCARQLVRTAAGDEPTVI